MEIKITADDLKSKKLMVATPMYGGMCAGIYTNSTNDLAAVAGKYGLDVRFYYLFNESLITRARNYCVDEFLRSDCTHLMFIDSDIGFNHRDVFTLLHLCNSADGKDIITGPYPKKTIAWEKVKVAADKGFGENPFDLENFIADFVFNPVEGISEFRIDEPVEIQEGGTGFMMISREALEKYAAAYPELLYRPDHVRTEHFDGSREITAFFDTVIDPASKRYLSEDYMFSQYARRIGLHIWLCPWMQLNHVGTYMFRGNMAALAAIQASPTADELSSTKTYTEGGNRQQRRAAAAKNKSK